MPMETAATQATTGADTSAATPAPSNGNGTPPAANASAPQSAASTGQATQATGGQPQTQAPTGDDSYQKRVQQQIAQLQSGLTQAQQRAAQAEQQAKLAALQGADPEQVASFWKGEYERTQQMAVAQQQQQQVLNQAFRLVQDAGVDPNDPRIVFPSQDASGIVQLSQSLVNILKADMAKMKADAEVANTRARQEALRESGALETSNGQGAAAGGAEQAKRELAAEWKQVQGSGDKDAYAKLSRKADKLGLNLSEL